MAKKGVVSVVFCLLLIFVVLSSFVYALQLNEPEFGYSSAGTFNVTVVAGSSANCRYSGIKVPFADMSMFDLSTSANTTYKKVDFVLSEGTAYDFYVNCTQLANPDVVVETAQYELNVDLTDPQITSASASPSQIADTPLETTLSVDTNELTFCKYGTTQVWDDMTVFSGTETDSASYRLNNSKLLTLVDNRLYNYAITCRDLANRTDTENVTVLVNTSLDPAITAVSPSSGSYLASIKVNLTVWTNKKTICWFGNTSTPEEQDGDYITEKVNHTIELDLTTDEYTYHLKCRFADLTELTTSTTFTLDTSPPSTPEVNDSSDLDGKPDYTPYDNKLSYKFESTDDESGIAQYNFSIWTSNTIVLEWTTTSDAEDTVGVDLENGEEYYFKVKAQNNAGLWSSEAQSDGITVDTNLTCETECGGSCPPCEAGESCDTDSDCQSQICTSRKCAAPKCTDKVQNGNESDVDCGGDCSGCVKGKDCVYSSDCGSGLVCVDDACSTAAHCANEEKDSDESDVDCGGLECAQCLKGEVCFEDDDCKSGECYGNVCSTKGDVDDDGIKDSDDNCIADANPDQEDMDEDDEGDACDADADGDGLLDTWETNYFGGIAEGNPEADDDEDSLTNKEELDAGTNPLEADTDNDGYTDKEELLSGHDPTNAESHPTNMLLFIIPIVVVVLIIAVFIFKKLPKSPKPPRSVPPSTPKDPPATPPPETPKPVEPSRRVEIPPSRPEKFSDNKEQRKNMMGQFEEKNVTEQEVFEKLKQVKKHFRR